MTAERPPLLFDYYGFPSASSQLCWPAPGSPLLAAWVRALAPLREEGVLILASGMSSHNLGAFFENTGSHEAQAFDTWLGEAVLLIPGVKATAIAHRTVSGETCARRG